MTLFLKHPELLARFRRGESDVLEVVYRTYVDDVERLLRMGFVTGEARVPGLSDRAQLSDTVQEIFARAFAKPARQAYDGVRPYRPLLLRIAKNLRVDQWRAQRREVSVSALPAAEGETLDVDVLIERNLAVPALPEPSPQERREWEALAARARRYLETLPADLRRFVELRYVQGLPQRDLAEMMRVSRRQIRALEAQVEVGLRRFLGETS